MVPVKLSRYPSGSSLRATLACLGCLLLACSSPISSPEPQSPAPTAPEMKPEAKPEPPKPTVPPWDEIVERFKPVPDSLGEVYYDMARYGCTRAAECGNSETIYECIERTVSEQCNQVDCSAGTEIDRTHELFAKCIKTLLDLPCGNKENRLECKIPSKQAK